MTNYILFGAYSSTICALAGFLCGIIWQELINQEVLNGSNQR